MELASCVALRKPVFLDLVFSSVKREDKTRLWLRSHRALIATNSNRDRDMADFRFETSLKFLPLLSGIWIWEVKIEGK